MTEEGRVTATRGLLARQDAQTQRVAGLALAVQQLAYGDAFSARSIATQILRELADEAASTPTPKDTP